MADDGRKPLPPSSRTEEVLGWTLTAVFCAGPLVLVIAGEPFGVVIASGWCGAMATMMLMNRVRAGRFGIGRKHLYDTSIRCWTYTRATTALVIFLDWITIDTPARSRGSR